MRAKRAIMGRGPSLTLRISAPGSHFVHARKSPQARSDPSIAKGGRLEMTNEAGLMKNRGEKIRNGKLRGEWAEMYFMTCAAEHGLRVNKPWGEMANFDFVIGDHGCLLRVQVKSTLCRKETGYLCTVVRGLQRRYTSDAFDFIAILVVPELAWYIVPVELILGKGKVALYPNSPKSRYARYKEAWHLLCPRSCPFLRHHQPYRS